MRFGNRKGFVIEGMAAMWLVVSLIVGAVAIFKGPEIIKSTGSIFNGGDKNQTRQVHNVTESYPIGHLDDKGKFVKMGDYKKKEEQLNLVAVQPPLTWMQKYGWILLLFGIAMIAFPSLAVKIYMRARSNLSQIVTGIEEAKTKLPKESVDILETNLSKKMDTSVKKQIKSIKAKLP